MKKTFLHISTVLAAVFSAAVLLNTAGCTNLDDVNARIDNLGSRIDSLEKQVQSANNNIVTMQNIVNAMKGNLAISSVETVGNGYKIIFSNGTVATIHNGTMPQIVVKYDEATKTYYWEVNGEKLTDGQGNPVPVNGTDAPTPKTEIGAKLTGVDASGNAFVADAWYMSADGGKTWVMVSGTSSEPGFQKVEIVGSEVVFTLANGTVIRVPYAKDFVFSLDKSSEQVVFGETLDVTITQNGVKGTQIAKPEGWKASISGNTLQITAPAKANAYAEISGEVSVLAVSESGYSTIAKVAVRAVETITVQAIDLSANGVSNCYIVADGAKTYSFSARYAGVSTTEISVGNPAADYLWADGSSDGNLLVSDVKYNAADKTITFKALGKDGNAVIALYDSQTQVIAYSWHLWIVDGGVPAVTALTSGQWLSRNIGALSSDPADQSKCYGMFYQWGRKDPFIGSKYDQMSATGSTGEDAAFGSWTADNYVNPVFPDARWDVKAAFATVAESFALPMQFAMSTVGGYVTADAIQRAWLAADGKKGPYDPCPAGYKTPSFDELLGITGSNAAQIPSGCFRYDFYQANASTPPYPTGTFNNGALYTGNGEANKMWWPATSYRHNNTGKLWGMALYGVAWCGEDATADGASAEDKNARTAREYLATTTQVVKMDASTSLKACGFPVRCIKEK